MADKNQKNTPDTTNPIDPEVEHRVDEMMSVDRVPSAPALSGANEVTEPVAKEAPKPKHESKAVSEDEPKPVEVIDNPIDDPTFDPMVDDIVAKESDELLARSDAAAAAAAASSETAKKPRRGLGGLLKAWWHNKPLRYTSLVALLVLLGVAGAYPPTRYYALNTVGVRSAASLTVVDNATQLPLKNVNVELGAEKSKTDEEGRVTLRKLELGPQSLTVSQPGFATLTETVTLGLGSNPLGDYKLQAVGVQFRVSLVDFVSGKPITDAMLSSEESNAQADDKGQIVLTVDQGDTKTREGKVTAQGYRDESLVLQPGQNQNRTIQLVPDRKHVYISKQSGKYDLYKTDIDGRNRSVLLAGTGAEDGNISVVSSPDGKEAAVVSKRDTLKNQDGFGLQSLTLVRVDKGTNLSLEKSERIQIVDWIGDRLVYVKIKAGSSAGSPDRYQLISYDYTNNSRQQLASANYFVDVISAGGTLYYASSNNFQGGNSQFVRIRPDNTGKQVLLDKTDVWNVARPAYDNLYLSNDKAGFTYKLGDSTAKPATQPPSDSDRVYVDGADNKRAVWTDSRDGKGVLLVTNTGTKKDTTVANLSGLSSPLRWLNEDTLVYRSNKPGETADYVVSLKGGEPKKITDVTATTGLGANPIF